MADSKVRYDEDGREYVVEDPNNDPAVMELAELKQKNISGRRYIWIYSACTFAMILLFLICLLVINSEIGYIITGICSGLLVIGGIISIYNTYCSIRERNIHIQQLEDARH